MRKQKSSKAKGTFMSTESKAKRVERQARLTLKNCKAQKIDDGGGFLTALGGVTSLAKAAEVTGLVAMAVERIEPWRDEGLVEHEIKTLLSQRLYLGACGHTDALDCSLFKDDPGLKSVLGLEPDGRRCRRSPRIRAWKIRCQKTRSTSWRSFLWSIFFPGTSMSRGS
ncbi:MAG: transposase [Candidatus Obscuribacter sp.]|nr:transposase [Candidatus Obscuribacter sp.]